MMYCPLVTILIPVYNGEKYVRDAIDSALNQTYKNIEIVVVNDGSTDSTETILESYGNRIRYVSKPNGGVSTALNTGISESTGEWISWLSHDDKYKPDKIKTQIERLNQLMEQGVDINKVVLYCANERIDINGNFISRKKTSYKENDSIIDAMLNNIKNYSICGCAVLVPKSAFKCVGEFRVDIPTCSDADMWYRMMFNGYRFLYMNNVLVQSRQHQAQVSKRKQKQCEEEQNLIHCEIARHMISIINDEKYVWKLECYLVQRGFEEAAQIVDSHYEKNFHGKCKFHRVFVLNLFRIKHHGRNILRSVYRKVTSK